MGCLGEFAPISDSKEFSRVYNQAKKWHCDYAVIYFLADDYKKVAAVASKKIGKAVVRNRAKRLLRAIFLNKKDNLQSGIYIFIAKKQIIEADFNQIQKSLNWAFRKIGCLK